MEGCGYWRKARKVTHAALEAGYNTPSAFISMFRRALGITPTSYFKSEAEPFSQSPK